MKNNKHNKKVITLLGVLALSAIMASACYTVIPLGYCSGSSSQGAKCINGCVAIQYEPEKQYICHVVTDNTGSTDCTSDCVDCVAHYAYETPRYFNGLCLGCGLPAYYDDEPAGSCNQDYESGTSCDMFANHTTSAL